jgi:hypothetical protein
MVEPSLSIDESEGVESEPLLESAAASFAAASIALESGFMVTASAAESTGETSFRADSFAVASGRLTAASVSPPSFPEIVVGAHALTTTAGTSQSH